MLSGLPGSYPMSVTLRLPPLRTPLIVILLNVGFADVALVERKRPIGFVDVAEVSLRKLHPMPPIPNVTPIKITSGLLGCTRILSIDQPLNTSLLLASLLRGPVISGVALSALSMR